MVRGRSTGSSIATQGVLALTELLPGIQSLRELSITGLPCCASTPCVMSVALLTPRAVRPLLSAANRLADIDLTRLRKVRRFCPALRIL